MKKTASLGWILLLLGVLLGSCENSNENSETNIDQLSLSEAIDQGAFNIEQAVEAIEKSNAYSLFVREIKNKSALNDEPPALNIYLEDIQGVYEYAPEEEEQEAKANNGKCQSYFQRTDDSDWFIIHMPFEKVQYPESLFNYDPAEEFINNLMITTSEFLFESDKSLMWYNYHLVSRFDVDEEYAGELWVDEVSRGFLNSTTSSKFGFTDEHFIVVETQFGDTIKVGYKLENSEEVLFSETVAFSLEIIDGKPDLQFEYEIQVGDVRIVMTLDEEYQVVYEVFKGDELQENASVEVIVSGGEASTSVNCLFMNQNKDLEITLDDESTVLLSELIGDSQEILAPLFNSMKELYLSKVIINQLAWQIYIEQDCESGGTE
jgi:hypothetical protein